MSEQLRQPHPEKREHPPFTLKVDMLSRASQNHHWYNEDALLGDVARIKQEQENPPALPLVTQYDYRDSLQGLLTKEQQYAAGLTGKNVFGIFDGLGGDAKGAGLLSSRIASAECSRVMSELPPDASSLLAIDHMKRALFASYVAMKAEKLVGGFDAMKEMGCTADLIRARRDGTNRYEVAYAHLGDSRIYAFDSETKKLRSITMDDNAASDMVKKKKITRRQYDEINDTEDPKKLNPKLLGIYLKRNEVSKTVQPDRSDEPTTGTFEVKGGDKVMLVTDGIHDNLTDKSIEGILAAGGTMRDLVHAAHAVAKAGKGRYKKDDLTGTIIEFPIEAGGAPAPEGEAVLQAKERLASAQRQQAESESRQQQVFEARKRVDIAADLVANRHARKPSPPAAPAKKSLTEKFLNWFGH